MNSQIITISVVLLSFSIMTEAGPTGSPCSGDDQCPSELACRKHICVDPCRKLSNRICTVDNHNPVYTCMSGYKFPPRSSSYCIPSTYVCHENGDFVKCESPATEELSRREIQ